MVTEDLSNIILICKDCHDQMYPDKGKLDVGIGNYVKIGFKGKYSNEYMWAKVTWGNGNEFEGILDNDPVIIEKLKCGDNVKFSKDDVCDIMRE